MFLRLDKVLNVLGEYSILLRNKNLFITWFYCNFMVLASMDGIRLLASAVLASLANNMIKFTLDFAKNSKPNFRLLYKEYGGMPSGHSAFLGAVVTALYIIEGLSVLFFVIAALSILLIVDLMAVRWFHGTQGRLMEQTSKMAENGHNEGLDRNLRALAGHKTTEMIAGLLLGILVSYLVFCLSG